MFCPVLEHQIQQHKKDVEKARILGRSGFCYFEVKDKSGKDLISNIVKMDCGEYLRKSKMLRKAKHIRLLTDIGMNHIIMLKSNMIQI